VAGLLQRASRAVEALWQGCGRAMAGPWQVCGKVVAGQWQGRAKAEARSSCNTIRYNSEYSTVQYCTVQYWTILKDSLVQLLLDSSTIQYSS